MDTVQLLQPILDGGLRSINFFNGRLLTGEDLSEEQKNWRSALERLGRALGDGIAYGLEVAISAELSPPTNQVITVQPGLAINRNGQALLLPQKINLCVVQPPDNATTDQVQNAFKGCDQVNAKITVTGKGVYLLTLAPASGTEGRAPVSGLGNVTATCNVRYKVEGVQFRLLPLPLSDEELSDTVRLRNRVAYKCFNVSGLTEWITNPFGTAPRSKGLLDELREARCLTDCQVPLAVLFWSDNRIQFVDMWSVRRRIARRSVDDNWSSLISDQRIAEAEAIFLQFQKQIEDILTYEISPENIIASKRFEYLPPVGILPLMVGKRLRGIDENRFFEGLTYRSAEIIEGAQLHALINLGKLYPAVKLENNKMFWLYRIQENIQIIDQRSQKLPQEYLVFACGHIPYFGGGKFNVNRWFYSNFA